MPVSKNGYMQWNEDDFSLRLADFRLRIVEWAHRRLRQLNNYPISVFKGKFSVGSAAWIR